MDDIAGFVINPGESKKFSLEVKNSGIYFLGKCFVQGRDDYETWIVSNDIKGLAGGEAYDFPVAINVPSDAAPGNYDVLLNVHCDKTNRNVNVSLEILEKNILFSLIKAEEDSPGMLKIVYSLEDVTGADQTVELQFLLFDSASQKISEFSEIKNLSANSKSEFESLIPAGDFSGGEISFLVNINSETYSTFVRESVLVGAPISGFAVFGEGEGGMTVLIVVIVGAFALFAFLVIRRILKYRKKYKR